MLSGGFVSNPVSHFLMYPCTFFWISNFKKLVIITSYISLVKNLFRRYFYELLVQQNLTTNNTRNLYPSSTKPLIKSPLSFMVKKFHFKNCYRFLLRIALARVVKKTIIPIMVNLQKKLTDSNSYHD